VIGELLGKALIVVKADTKQAREEIAKLSAAEQAAAKERIAAQDKVNASYERGTQKWGLYAAAGAAAFGILSSSVDKYREHLKKLGDSGADDLDRLNRMTGSLSKAQDNLQIAIGKVAMAAEPAALALAEMANQLARIVGGVGDVLNKVKENLPGGGPSDGPSSLTVDGRALSESVYWRGGGMAQLDPRLMRAMSVDETPGWTGGRDSPEGSTMSPEWYQAMGYRLVMTSDGGYTWIPPEKKKPGRGRPRMAEEGPSFGFLGGIWGEGAAGARNIYNEVGAAWDQAGAGRDYTAQSAFGTSTDPYSTGMDEYRQQMAGKKSRLEEIFGPISDFDAYTTAWQGLESVVSAGLNAWIDGSKSAGAAMKEALHGFAKNLAGEALLQALRHGAYALGSLALGDPRSAATHGIAAAKWGAVAAAATVIGKVTNSAGASASGGAYAAAGIGGRGGGGDRPGVTLNVVMGDNFAGDSPRHVERRFRRNMDRARQYAESTGAVPG
jgi:hypothetical protein